MRNILCKKCEDKGFVGFFRKKTCPVCNGNPKSLLSPKPQIKPPGQKIEKVMGKKLLKVYMAANKTSCLFFEDKRDADTYAGAGNATSGIEVTEIIIIPSSKR